MKRDDLRFLLIQARNPDDPVRHEEQVAFAAQIGVLTEQIVPVDMLRGTLDPALLTDVDCVLVGGSGEYSVLDDHAGIQGGIAFLGHCAERGFPTFGSCFGFQALTLALGGTVVHDGDNAEVGTFWLETTPAAADDPVFCTLPERFLAQEGHKDRASVLPAGVTNFARSERCPYQGFRVNGQPVYATQFHPELTGPAQSRRFRRYWDHYAHFFGEEEALRILHGFADSPEASALMSVFVDEVLLGDDA